MRGFRLHPRSSPAPAPPVRRTPPGPWTEGEYLIRAERVRQVEAEGYTAEHDDEHCVGELARAASCYRDMARMGDACVCPISWPWEPRWWKPSADAVRNLVKAGALFEAEAARYRRMELWLPAVAVDKDAAACAREIDRLLEVMGGGRHPSSHRT